VGTNSLFGPLDPAPDAGYSDAPPRVGFFTDTSICIGCKACEVACKTWNAIPDDGIAEGTVRCLDDEAWHRAPEMMKALLQSVAAAYDVEASLEYVRGKKK